jgi:hypothetical protein
VDALHLAWEHRTVLVGVAADAHHDRVSL